MTEAHPNDRDRVEALLGRPPMGPFKVVHRDLAGDPVVIENAPFLDDGTPMPTRFWLIGTEASHRVAVLEANGGVRRAEIEISADLIAAAHARHADGRDAAIPSGHEGPRPTGGVGGTRQGVKCLHAHYAAFLAGEQDPVGEWVHEQLNRVTYTVDLSSSMVRLSGDKLALDFPVIPNELLADASHDRPPHPIDLTNAIGEVSDLVDDALRTQNLARPSSSALNVIGETGTALARLETGSESATESSVDREVVEELFRMLATDGVTGRLDHPGLLKNDGDLLPSLCIVVAIVRRLNCGAVTFGQASGQ